MVDYPCSFELEIYFEAYHLYDVCQVCLPILQETNLPSITGREIFPNNGLQLLGLEEELARLRTQKENGDKDAPWIFEFVVGEGDENQGSDLDLGLCYYDNRESSHAGKYHLSMYIHERNTFEEIQEFIDCCIDFCHKLIPKANVHRVILHRSGNSGSYIPSAPLLDSSEHIAFVTEKMVAERYYNFIGICYVLRNLVRFVFGFPIPNQENGIPSNLENLV